MSKNYEDDELDLELDQNDELDSISDDDEDLSFPEDERRTGPVEEDEDADPIIVEDDDDEEVEPQAPARKPAEKKHDEKPGKKKIGNPYAALRTAERNQARLEARLERLMAVLEEREQEPEKNEEEEIEVPPYEQDPIGNVAANQKRVEKKIDSISERQRKKEEEAAFARSIQEADNAIVSFKSKVGEDVYNEAIQYAVELRRADVAEAYPELSDDEVERVIAVQALQEKVKAMSAGKNPGKLFYDYAVRHGFRPSKKEQREEADPRASIRREREKESRARTIAGTRGKPAGQKLSAGEFVGMSDEDFDDYLSSIEKEGGKRRGTLRISDLVATSRGR